MNIKAKSRIGLTVALILFMFSVLIATFILVSITAVVLHAAGVIQIPFAESADIRGGNPFSILFGIFFLCTLLGTTLTAFLSKRALDPIRKVIRATHKVAEGDYDVSVEIKGIYELEELAVSFNKMTQELSGIETLRRDFINNFSHEFKTPIVSIRGFAKLLNEGKISDEEKKDYLEIIITESERLAELSTNILSLSKYEAIEIITEKAPFKLDEQIRRAIAMTEPKWTAKNIEMNIGLDEVNFNGNENLMQQIWLNLIDNAIKFSEHDGSIGITLMGSSESIFFSIQDNGIGMTDEIMQRVFDKFYQGDKSHKKSGNGLGLAMVKRIVDLCGGTIEVNSEIGKGSIFSVTLPV
jgi:signal transduction histidine kinase